MKKITFLFCLLASFPSLACTNDGQELPGSCCSSLGASQMSGTQTDIIACVYEDEAHTSLIWKSFTGGSEEPGQIVIFDDSCPAGWTKRDDFNGHALLGKMDKYPYARWYRTNDETPQTTEVYGVSYNSCGSMWGTCYRDAFNRIYPKHPSTAFYKQIILCQKN